MEILKKRLTECTACEEHQDVYIEKDYTSLDQAEMLQNVGDGFCWIPKGEICVDKDRLFQ